MNTEEKFYFYTVPLSTGPKIPITSEKVAAGFPSPADGYIEGELDLNTLLIKNPPATFFIRVEGESMINAGIFSGDIIIVDKSITPKNGSIVIAILNGEFTLKRFYKRNKEIELLPENPAFKKIIISEQDDFDIWGVVKSVIHNY